MTLSIRENSEIMLVYGILQETVSAIMMLYKNTHLLVWSPNGDTKIFNVIVGVLQGDMFAPFLFIVCLDYTLRTSDLNTPIWGSLLKKQ